MFFCERNKYLDLIFTLLFSFLFVTENKTCWSGKNPYWFCEESIMALGGVRHGTGRNPSWLWEKSVTCGNWLLLLLAIFQHDGYLAEPWKKFPRAMTNFSQTHQSLLQISKTQKTGWKLSQKFFFTKRMIHNIKSVNCNQKKCLKYPKRKSRNMLTFFFKQIWKKIKSR